MRVLLIADFIMNNNLYVFDQQLLIKTLLYLLLREKLKFISIQICQIKKLMQGWKNGGLCSVQGCLKIHSCCIRGLGKVYHLQSG